MKENTPIYADCTKISKFLIWLLVAGALLDIVATCSSYLEYALLVAISEGQEITEETANANDLRQGLIGLSQILLFLVTAIVFCRWTYQIMGNARAVSDKSMKHSPGWAVGYYFIPVVNLWKPYQSLREAYEIFIGLEQGKKDKVVFPLWWSAWIVSGILGQIVFKLSLKAEELEQLIQASMFTIGSDAFDIFLDVMAVFLVLLVTRSSVAWLGTRHDTLDAQGG